MSDLIDTPAPGQNAPEYTVSEVSGAVKRLVEGEFTHIRVRAELGRVTRARSGHIYMDLKDDRAVLSAVVWKGQAARLRIQPQEGIEVVATGRLTTFAAQSRYQMVIDSIAPAGVGALMALLERRKAALMAEGLFDTARKRPIPFLPDVIGVVTSPTGAVIRDILHRLRDRFPRRVVLWPVVVQGDACAPQVRAAIEGFNRLSPGGPIPRPDVLIVARGGGSVEDLWGFNDEAVVRMASASDIPLISAVGHETDTTLIDLAADLRAPTPTAAAELAVPVRAELLNTVTRLGMRAAQNVHQDMAGRGTRLADLSRGLPRTEALVGQPAQRLDHVATRLMRAPQMTVQRCEVQLSRIAARLRPPAQATAAAGQVAQIGTRLAAAERRLIEAKSNRLHLLSARLRPGELRQAHQRKHDALTALSTGFARAAGGQINTWNNRLTGLDRLLHSLGYQATLKRGFAVVRDGADHDTLITSKQSAATARSVALEFHDGLFTLSATPAPPRKSPKKPRGPGGPPPISGTQGTLF